MQAIDTNSFVLYAVGAQGSSSAPVIDRTVSYTSPTVLTVECKVVWKIFFKNRFRLWLLKCSKSRNFYYMFYIHVLWSFIFVMYVIFMLYVLLYICYIFIRILFVFNFFFYISIFTLFEFKFMWKRVYFHYTNKIVIIKKFLL